MATTVSSQLARLRRKRKDANEAHRKSAAASLNKYGKAVQKSFQEGLVSRANLIAKREERENKQQTLRERFAAATSTVLSKDTLDFLREQSRIAAPTLTALFAGYESARADRANRLERAIDSREEGLKRVQAADDLAFRDQAAQRQEQLRAQGNILNSGQATQNAIFASDGQQLTTEAQFTRLEQEQTVRVSEAVKARNHAVALQKQRDKMAQERQSVSNTQALARMDRQIAAAQTAASLAEERRQASAELLVEQKQAAANLAEQRRQAGITRTDNLSRERATTAFERDQELIGLRQTNTLAEIEARAEGQLEVKTAAGGSTSSGSTTSSFFTQLKEQALKGDPVPTVTPAEVSPEPVTGEVDGVPVTSSGVSVLPAIDTDGIVTENPVDAPVIFATDPEPTPVTEPTTVDDAPGADVVSQLTPEETAQQVLTTRLGERDPDALANLGEDVTFAQLVDFFNPDDEDDAEVLAALDTFRNLDQARVV